MADGVWVQPELLRDGADFPMFGVEPVTDLYAQFTVEHAHLRKIRGNGSTKRPRRPQRTQRSKPWCPLQGAVPLGVQIPDRKRTPQRHSARGGKRRGTYIRHA